MIIDIMSKVNDKCKDCNAPCCRRVLVGFGEEPTWDVKYYLSLHQGLEVIFEKGKWWLKIDSPCTKLINNKCSIYKDRPDVCKLYECNYK